jgi:hypothetical protein
MKNKRVVVRLTGGLGNQLHQYAYGLLLANKIQAEILFDKEFLVNYSKKLNITFRDIEINKFDLNVKFYKSILSNHFVLRLIKKIKFISSFLEFFNIKVITQYQQIDSLILKDTDFIYLDGIIGNYQDYKNDVDLIKRSLNVSPSFTDLVEIVKEEIDIEDSVSIHVRRSDYLKEGSIHHILDMSYYQKAIEYFESNTENPVFYVFSDDRQFVEESFKGKNMRMIDYSGKNPDFFDFLAIKKCKHHIIANSTFSWWAAFLESVENRKTIAPSIFLKTEELDLKSTYPENWIIF